VSEAAERPELDRHVTSKRAFDRPDAASKVVMTGTRLHCWSLSTDDASSTGS
jgi:hypothetical protein